MMEWSIFWWPFGMAFAGLWMLFSLVLLAFWVWMLIDCVQRIFRDSNEKIIWIIVIVLGSWIGALVYFFAIRTSNPKGLVEQKTRKN
jgi:glycopeptide antibiotics resistance protein